MAQPKIDACVTLAATCREIGLPKPNKEFYFHPKRKWRFDLAWPEQKIAVEIEGGTWISGRHSRGSGFEKDCMKYNTAATMGWRVLRFTTKHARGIEAAVMIKECLKTASRNPTKSMNSELLYTIIAVLRNSEKATHHDTAKSFIIINAAFAENLANALEQVADSQWSSAIDEMVEDA